MAYDNLGLDHQLCFALYAASNAVTRQYRPLLAQTGLTYPQYLVLLALWDRGPAAVKTLADTLQIDSATLTPMLQRLESAGLVTRQRDRRDERRLIVQPTRRADGLRRRLAAIQKDVACSTGLSETGLATLRAQLNRLAARLEGK